MEFNCAKHHEPNCIACEEEWQRRQEAEREKNFPTRIVDVSRLKDGGLRRFAGEVAGVGRFHYANMPKGRDDD